MSNLRKIMSSKDQMDIRDDLEEIINQYLYDKLVRGIIAESSFTNECVEAFEKEGIPAQIEQKAEELASIIKQAYDIAEDLGDKY